MLSKQRLDELLRALAADLDARGVQGDIFVVGGAAMTLAYNTREVTRDIDGIFEPKKIIYELAEEIASRYDDVDPDWLNDGAKSFIPGEDPNATVFLDIPGLCVRMASPRFLLAMKLFASRVDRDSEDIRDLLRFCGITSVDEALDLVAAAYPYAKLSVTIQYLLEEILAAEG